MEKPQLPVIICPACSSLRAAYRRFCHCTREHQEYFTTECAIGSVTVHRQALHLGQDASLAAGQLR